MLTAYTDVSAAQLLVPGTGPGWCLGEATSKTWCRRHSLIYAHHVHVDSFPDDFTFNLLMGYSVKKENDKDALRAGVEAVKTI